MGNRSRQAAFSALVHSDEADPKELVKQQFTRAQRKPNRAANMKQVATAAEAPSNLNKPLPSSCDCPEDDDPVSPGSAVALTAIVELGNMYDRVSSTLAILPPSTSSQPKLHTLPTASTIATTAVAAVSLAAGQAAQGAAGRQPHQQASAWQHIALDFAADAGAVGDIEFAVDAAAFGIASAAGLPWLDVVNPDQETAAAMAAAEAAGVSYAEVVMAQQHALMHEASKKATARAVNCMCEWLAASLTSTYGAVGSCSPCCGTASPSSHKPPTVQDFSGLASSSDNSPVQQQPRGRSLHVVPHGWQGGRMAPKAKGIKVLNSGSCANDHMGPKPSGLDLHYDLTLDGLKLKDDGGELEAEAAAALGLSGVSRDEAVALYTGLLLAEHNTAAAADDDDSSNRRSSRDRCSQDVMRSMMAKLDSRAQGGSHTSDDAGSNASGSVAAMADDESLCGAKQIGYDWKKLFVQAITRGWQPVTKADGGGGTHHKLRRVLPISGVVQTCMLACTPGDSQRACRNAASALDKKDRERDEIEAAAAARATAAGDGSSSNTGATAGNGGSRPSSAAARPFARKGKR